MSTTQELLAANERYDRLRAAVYDVAFRWEARADDYVEPVASIFRAHARQIRTELDRA